MDPKHNGSPLFVFFLKIVHKVHKGFYTGNGHRIGYKQLCAAIPCYARDDTQSLTKELYPSIARRFGYPNCGPVEHAIRLAILDGWERGRREVWEGYFPCALRPPSNKLFIATLAERLKQIDPQS